MIRKIHSLLFLIKYGLREDKINTNLDKINKTLGISYQTIVYDQIHGYFINNFFLTKLYKS